MNTHETRYRKSDKGALHVRQIPELGGAFRGWLARHEQEWDFFGASVGQEALVNALILDFLDSSPEDQAAILRRSLPKQENMERAWNRAMRSAIARGEYELDPKGVPVRRKAGQQANQPQPDGAPAVIHSTPADPTSGRPKVTGPRRTRRGA